MTKNHRRRLGALLLAALGAASGVGSACADQPYLIHRFDKHQLTDKFFSEGATIADVNKDGQGDVVLAFVQAFSVFPSAVVLGAPAGPTRVISIAAYTAAFEEYDYAMASAIAMIMGFVQLAIVVAVLALRGLFYRGSTTGGKG